MEIRKLGLEVGSIGSIALAEGNKADNGVENAFDRMDDGVKNTSGEATYCQRGRIEGLTNCLGSAVGNGASAFDNVTTSGGDVRSNIAEGRLDTGSDLATGLVD